MVWSDGQLVMVHKVLYVFHKRMASVCFVLVNQTYEIDLHFALLAGQYRFVNYFARLLFHKYFYLMEKRETFFPTVGAG